MRRKTVWAAVLGVLLIATLVIAVVSAQTPTPDDFASNVFTTDGGNLLIVASGGEIEVQSGGTLDVDGTAALTNVDASGYVKAGVATPVVVTSLAAGDGVFSDDVEVVDDMHVTGAMKIGVPTPVGITWDDDDLAVKDDVYIEGDIQAQSYIKVGVATPVAITAPAAGDIIASDDLEVMDDSTLSDDVKIGGDITLENSEKITNSSDGTVAFTDGTNTLATIVDAGSAGNLSVTGTAAVTGLTTHTGGESIPVQIENIRQPSVIYADIPYTAAAGGTGTVATIGAGETWIVHSVLVSITTSFAADGDDATLVIGDGDVTDGFCTLADADLQADATDGTGFAVGWSCMTDATIGAYLDEVDSGFVYDGTETIDWIVSESSGTTLSAGLARVYVVYTRIE